MFFDDVKKKKQLVRAKGNLSSYKYSNIAFDEMTDNELASLSTNSMFVYDTESFPNYWLAAFKLVGTNKVVTFETNQNLSYEQSSKLRWIMENFLTVGFNSLKYDNFVIWLAINGYTAFDLNQASFSIINGMWKEELEKIYNTKFPRFNTIDVINVCPHKGSLKRRAGQLHAKRMQDMPIDPDKRLSENQCADIKAYCFNDLANTELVWDNLQEQIKLRYQLTQDYQTDVRSKSDAQIAEAVISAEFKKRRGFWPKKPKVDLNSTVKYDAPSFICFQTKEMRHRLELLSSVNMTLDESGHVILPTTIREQINEIHVNSGTKKKVMFKLGSSFYTIGLGGVHSCEENICHKSDDEYMIIDNDVASYYPAIILNQGLYPTQLGETFITIYKDLVDKRLTAKKLKNKPEAESLKITINGTFGKFSDLFSVVYSPKLHIQTTLTGQLSVLMLIEAVELAGFTVISGNTDGFVTKVKRSRKAEFDNILRAWEKHTNFILEETEYSAIYSRDINNYIAVKTNGKCKTKGFFANPWIDPDLAIFRFHKNPEHTICSEAVCDFLSKGTPVKDTVYNCKDITKFVSVRNVKGGGEKDGIYIGKVVRWYYATNTIGNINYCLSGNSVPKSDGAKPLMELPTILPSDIDYERYVSICMQMLEDLGYYKKLRLL